MISPHLHKVQTGCSRSKIEGLRGFSILNVSVLPFEEFGRDETWMMSFFFSVCVQ